MVTRETLSTWSPHTAHDHSGVESDAQLVSMWLALRRSAHTQRAYCADAQRFLEFVATMGRSLRTTTARDLQQWATTLVGAPSSCARRVAAIRALLTLGQRVGYLAFNVGGVIQPPRVHNTLAERILDEASVSALIAAAAPGRDRVLLRVLYLSGARVSEICALCWKHVHALMTGDLALTLHGKGGRTRHVLLPGVLLQELEPLRDGALEHTPVFRSQRDRALDPSRVVRIVKRAAVAAGLSRSVSPHWLRHAHASHALDRGAPVSLVQATLGHASLATTGRYTHARPSDGSARYLKIS